MYNELGNDEIRIEDLEVYAYHGVYPEEKEKGQTFFINATLYTDTHKAGLEDKLELSTNYGDVCMFINQWMEENTYQLLEAVAEKLSKAILLKYDLISSVDLEIRKPEAPIELPFGCVSVKIHRGWHKVYLALGSNIGNKEDYINGAIHALREHPQMKVNKISDMIVTEPYGGVEQDDFLNGVLEAETLLSPEELLEACHDIEDAANRKRTIHWGPRTLDIDILFYDKLIFESDTLVIPHPDLENRDFVLKPMNMLAPNFRHPVLKKTMSQLLQELKK